MEKWLLKQACAELVPDAVLHRKKSPYPTAANLAYEQFLRAQTQALLQQADNPVFQIIDRTQLRRELNSR